MMFFINKVMMVTILIVALLGCSRNDGPTVLTEGQRLNGRKTEAAQQACREINWLKPEYSGQYTNRFIRCASNRRDGGESLSGLLAVTDKITPAGFDQLIALSKFVPSTQSKARSVQRYPILADLVILLERGEWRHDNTPYSLAGDAKSFQDLLDRFNPYLTLTTIFEFSRGESFASLLEQLALWDRQVAAPAFLALTREVLRDSDLRTRVHRVLDEVLTMEQGQLYTKASEMATITTSYDYLPEVKDVLTKSWSDGLIDDAQVAQKEQLLQSYFRNFKSFHQKGQGQNGRQRYSEYLQSIGSARADKIAGFFNLFVQRFVAQDEQTRLNIADRLIDNVRANLQEQKYPLRNYYSMAYRFEQTPIVAMNFFVDAVNDLLNIEEAQALKYLHIKVGGSLLQSHLEQILIDGARFTRCHNLQIRGLKDLAQKKSVNYQEWDDRLMLFMQPNTACPQGLSPLAIAILDYFSSRFACEDSSAPYCVAQSDYPLLANELKKEFAQLHYSHLWANKAQGGETSPSGLLKQFVVRELERMQQELAKDPYILYWRHLAYTKVMPTELNWILQSVREAATVDAQTLTDLDAKIALRNSHLVQDFMERFLDLQVGQLQGRTEQFNDLLELGNDQKVYRLLDGVYNGGPYEQMIANQFYVEQLPSTVSEKLPAGTALRLHELMARLREPGALFVNQSLDATDPKIEHNYLGDRSNFIAITDEGFDFSKLRFLSLKNIFPVPQASGEGAKEEYTRIKALLDYGDLVGKDVLDWKIFLNQGVLSDEFATFVKQDLLNHFLINHPWEEILQSSQNKITGTSLDEFVERVEEFNQEELLQLLVFYSMNYFVVPNLWDPQIASVNIASTAQKRFYSLPNDGVRKWSSYLAHAPRFTELRATIESLSDDEVLSIYRKERWKVQLNNQTALFELAERGGEDRAGQLIKGLSVFNLMTENRARLRADKNLPVVGVGRVCWNERNQPETCVLDFKSIKDLKSYLIQTYQLHLCPYILPQYGLTDDLISLLKIKLPTILGDSELVDFCQKSVVNNSNYINVARLRDTNQVVPFRIYSTILKDMIQHGKRSLVHPELVELGMKIRFEKSIRRNQYLSADAKVRMFLNTPGMMLQNGWSFAQKKMADHKGFMTFLPGLLNVYIHAVKNPLDHEQRFENALAELGAHELEDPSALSRRGQAYAIVQDFLLPLEKEFVARDASTLETVVAIGQRLKNRPRDLKFISYLLAYPENIETLSIWNDAIPKVINHVRDVKEARGERFSWNEPGLLVLRQVFRQENLRGLCDMVKDFGPAEINDGLRVIGDAIGELGSEYDAYVIGKYFVQFVQQMIASTATGRPAQFDQNFILADQERTFKEILQLPGRPWLLVESNRLLESLKNSYVGFDHKSAPSILAQSKNVALYVVHHIHELFELYQNLPLPPGHAKRVIESYQVFTRPEEVDQSAYDYLIALIEHPDLSSWQTLYSPLLQSAKGRQLLVSSMTVLDRPSREDYLQATEELDQLLGAAHKLFKYVAENSRWSEQAAPEVISIFHALKRLSNEEYAKWQQNVANVKRWLSEDSNRDYRR